MTGAADAAPAGFRPFSFNSFRAKFVLVVGAAVLFDLLLSGGLALWNVQRLSRDAAFEVGEGLTSASQEYLRTYVDATAGRADLLLDRVHAEVNALAGAMQAQIDRPTLGNELGRTLASDPAISGPLVYNDKGGWAQNGPGTQSVVSVWGYLLDAAHKPRPDVQKVIDTSATLDLFAPSLMATGSAKLQMYYIGPKNQPIFRTVPYTDQEQTFDKLYPGHNEANFWDFFFPGVYEGWQGWIANPASRPVANDLTMTAPYTDAITGNLIVSFFHPLWTADRKDVAGVVGTDISLEQLAGVVQSVKVADSGFGFLAMSNGNVLAVNEAGQKTLGIEAASDASSQGVTGVDRSLRKSKQNAIATLPLEKAQDGVVQHVFLEEAGEQVPYVVVLKHLNPTNLWTSGPIGSETMSIGIVVPEREIYAALLAAQDSISSATNRIVMYQVLAIIVCMLVVLAAVFAISGRITAGLRALADAAHRLQNKDYSVRVAIPARDEVAAVGVAFNRMAEEISYHTENLENLVAERTRALETANEEISALNSKLKSENLRLGAELDVARHIQMMVLPRRDELDEIKGIDVSGYMEPADEVGGDYFDVLHDERRMKVGIGDVTGHGLESGVLMLMVQSVARALQEQGDEDPREFLEVLNRAVFKNIQRTKTDKHLSLAFLDYEDRKITLSGQHEEVLVLRGNDEVERIDTIDLGFPIGLESDIGPFVGTHEFSFDTGDVIVLHTDGVTEAESPNGELFGFDRLCESAQRHRQKDADAIKDGIIADLMAHIGTQKIHDDITLVVMKHR